MLLGGSLIFYFNLRIGWYCTQTLDLVENKLHITHRRLFFKYRREIELDSISYEEFVPSNALTGKDDLIKERLAIPIINNKKWVGQIYRLNDLEQFINMFETGANKRDSA